MIRVQAEWNFRVAPFAAPQGVSSQDLLLDPLRGFCVS